MRAAMGQAVTGGEERAGQAERVEDTAKSNTRNRVPGPNSPENDNTIVWFLAFGHAVHAGSV